MDRLILSISFLFFLGALTAEGGGAALPPGGGSLVATSVSAPAAEPVSTLAVDNMVPNIDSLTDEEASSVAEDLNKK